MSSRPSHIARVFAFAAILLLGTACGHDNQCHVDIGAANFSRSIYQDAECIPLTHPGGHVCFSGGHRGIIVICVSQNNFVAFERTCPCDNSSIVDVSEEWGSFILECPRCHTLFDVNNGGATMAGGATPCPLYQYGTTFDGTTLYVY